MKSDDIPSVPGLSSGRFRLGPLVERVEAPGRANWLGIPSGAGIYVVFLPPDVPFEVRQSIGKAIHASPAPVADLHEKWSRINSRTSTDILYIGKGDNVQKRVRALARFGAGKARNHKGGEWMWQVTHIRSAKILIVACPHGKQVPFEKWLLDSFSDQHRDWPLANRKGGDGYETWSP
jgi:hypothetical protein